jgi:GNAT superfamily N-acetyltransferase
MSGDGDVEIHPVTADRLGDLADLFESNGTTRGCWCMFFIAERAEFGAGMQNGGNRRAFEALAATADPPVGLLAYDAGTPVGWCALGPRSRYARAISRRATILKARDPSEDDDVWLVPCFFVRVGSRRRGLTRRMLSAAVELAKRSGAQAIEGFPRAAGERPTPDDYLGKEQVFAACGFECIARPTPRRAVMRRHL